MGMYDDSLALCFLILERKTRVYIAVGRFSDLFLTPEAFPSNMLSDIVFRVINGNYRSGTVRDFHPVPFIHSA